ncbi:MAG: DEAD/DEAH box helicase [Deltaproteobacteria bacterium]|nr:DEAD/DEAH box helicase [Deltaproteobacteria bacterium]
MDIFALRDRVVAEYRDYFESFINILDDRLLDFVKERLADGEMWPDAVLQLNPAYEPGPTLRELAAQGVVTPEPARFFGESLRLYRHQEEALQIARRGEPYIVSTGTGSGKSLTYLIPIFDHIIRNDPDRHSVRAIIVYPMNALINSQLEALERFKKNWPECSVRFARYTGQEKQEDRNAILSDPPHILLTNYVMLEYMLIRPYERTLVRQATRELKYLVMDELHFYRGRQGADVAMLMRRVRQRAGRPDLQFVGTSATLVTEGDREARRGRIAEVGAQLFGTPVPNVVDETLKRVAAVPAPQNQEELRAAVQLAPPEPTLEAVTHHPLAAWVEETFGLQVEDGRLVRRTPIAFSEGLKLLVEKTGLEESLCLERLKAVLDAGNAAQLPSGEPVFAFRLHQFMASGSSVYTTLEPAGDRYLTTAGHYVVPQEEGQEKVLFPLAFCRECGQEYYLASMVSEGATTRLVPRSPLLTVSDEDISGTPGFFSLEDGELWEGQLDDLPENWLEMRKGGVRPKRNYADHVPQPYWVTPDGVLTPELKAGAQAGWFQPRPLMLCLRCRAAYDLREKSDYRKLSTLSQVGRSTATTITSTAAVVAMRQDEAIDPAARKVLSFTDNRQDASLQAGHLNDFTQVILLRGALVRALEQEGALTLDRLGPAIFQALNPQPEDFMKFPVPGGPGFNSAKKAMVDLIDYLVLEDLARAWRIAQPNLEQCGLLRIKYDGLTELAQDESLWADVPVISEVDGAKREAILQAVLDYLRGVLALDAGILEEDHTRSLVNRANEWLREPWTFDKNERLRRGTVAILPQGPPNHRNDTASIRLGFRSAIGRYLRSRHTWGRDADLSGPEVEALILHIVSVLGGHIFSIITRNGVDYGIQIRAGALRWEQGDGKAPGPDPVRAKSLYLRREEHIKREPNRFFEDLYAKEAQWLTGIIGGEHTGQIQIDRRIEREKDFREGKLPALFCSPTMELGVDIADLTVVHLRNVPPTPANYAQRSGRAGRGGKPALVLAFSSYGNAHDQYFFRHKTRMIAGSVAPPRMDLGSKDLVEAHLHSVWLAMAGLNMGSSMVDLLDLNSPNYPLLPEKAAALNLSEPRQQEVIAAFQAIVALVGEPITKATWFSPQWLVDTVRVAPEGFNRSLDRWRELYKAAVEQRDAARRKIDNPRLGRREREEAERQQQEALREIDLLLNRGEQVTETDFYPYRYLATEGFLPGYNFPRLPLRALVWTGVRTETIDRPRFLGLAEFGPQNVIYHEGRKHRVTACRMPGGDIDRRVCRAKLCLVCGYIHPRDEAAVDLCHHCGTRMDGNNSEFPQRLLDQPTVRASRWVRITSEEEERAREGYHLTTHFWFSPGTSPQMVNVQPENGSDPILEMTYVPQAELWRINHGWRRSEERNGFNLDAVNGKWLGGEVEQEENGGGSGGKIVLIPGLKPYVTDNRNILLFRPLTEEAAALPFLKTLAYALQRGIQVNYQVEEQEVAAELIGRDEHQRILLWEAAEGGTGVWERILSEPRSLAEIAREALRICHFNPDTGEEDKEREEPCGPACYDCLLSYSNQTDHRFLDRFLVRDFLLQLAKAKVLRAAGARSYDEQYQWLLDNLDPVSSLEREFLDYLYIQKLRLPDFAQFRPDQDVHTQPDFYYKRDRIPGVCIFVDGPPHDNPHQAQQDKQVREALQEKGYRVVVIRHDQPFNDQVSGHTDIFGNLND